MVVGLIEKAKSKMPDVEVEEIDVAANPAVGVKYRVMSTPAIAINGKLEFTGVPREEALLAKSPVRCRSPEGSVGVTGAAATVAEAAPKVATIEVKGMVCQS